MRDYFLCEDFVMSYIFPIESYAGDPIELVPVIASYDAQGHIRPLYVRIKGERYKVENYWEKSIFGNNIDFNATLSKDNKLYKLILTYHIRETTWSIPKYLVEPKNSRK